MNLLLISEIRDGLTLPAFGGEFAAHIARKTHPAVRAASLTAWNLLAEGLGRMGYAGPGPGSARLGDVATGSAPASGKMPLMSMNTSDMQVLPAVRFSEYGKPEFSDCPLFFSLAHSGKLAVALLSSSPCGVDVERIRPGVDERLRARCLSPEEQRLGLDFFECWVKKECIGKLNGKGIDAHPGKIDTLDARWAGRFYVARLVDSAGQRYALAALCEDAGEIDRSIVRI